MIRSLVFLMVAAVLLTAACGGGGSQRQTANSGTTNRAVASSNSAKPGEAAPEGNNTAAANSDPADPTAVSRAKRSDAIRQAASEQPRQPIDIEAVLKQSTRPAPENSEFAVALTDVLVERRTFNRHAVLGKVEKVTEGERSTIYVFTKDGSKRELPGASIPSISTAPSAVILQAIGIEPQRAPVSGSKSKSEAKN